MRLSQINNVINNKRRFKIIGIDDEAGIVNALRILTQKQNYEFEGYTDANEGIEKIKSGHFDLLILDFLLEDTNGYEVVEKIREFNKDLYILLLTGHSESAPPLETLERCQIQGYCTKSNDPSQLVLMIKSAHKSVELMNEIRITRDGLNNVLMAAPHIYQLKPIEHIIDEAIKNLSLFTNTNNSFIIVDNVAKESGVEMFFKGTGRFDTDPDDFTKLFNPLLMQYAGSSRIDRKITASEEGIFCPLVNINGSTMGVIFVETKSVNLQILEVFSNQVASSVSNALLHSILNIKNEELNKTYEVMRTRYEETINTLRLTVDAKDEYTRGHSDRVAEYALKIGKTYEYFSEDDLRLLRVGGIFHDIGKIGTADDILLSDKKLSQGEFEEIKKHPETGASILSALSMFSDIVPIILHHHERIDGTGYPKGLKGEEIPIHARILAVADAFDAMTTNRVYRTKLSLEEAIAQLNKGAGTQFDSDVCRRFIQLLSDDSVEFTMAV